MIVKRAQLVHLRRVFANFRPGSLDVFQVLTAARVRTENRSDEGQRFSHAIVPHLSQRVGEKRMPVAISPINRKLRAAGGEQTFETGDQRAILIVDRASAVEMIIVLRYFEHPLAWNVAATQNVLKKRNDVGVFFRSAE